MFLIFLYIVIMVLTKTLNMSWIRNKKYYMDLGYIFTNMYEFFEIKIEHLNKNSHYRVKVKCSHCNNDKTTEYRKYNEAFENKGFYVCGDCRYEKTKITNLEKYGVENISYLDSIKQQLSENGAKTYFKGKEKRDNTNIEKYGFINPFQNQDIIDNITEKTKKTKIERGLIIPDDKLTEFKIYNKIVRNLTHKNEDDVCVVDGDLYLSHCKLISLPDNLTINGDLYCNYNNLTSLPDNLTVKGDLRCIGNKLTNLPENLTVSRDIRCGEQESGISLELPSSTKLGGGFII